MISISGEMDTFCCVCDAPRKDARIVTFSDKYKQRRTEIALCKKHMRALRDCLDLLFDDTVINREGSTVESRDCD